MRAFELDDLCREQTARGRLYFEFLRRPNLSMGVYRLPAGGADPQGPHSEDEVYYIAAGQATMTVGEDERAVRAGSIVYVPADVPHRFHSIREELLVLVLFAPAEYSRGSSGKP